MSSCLRRLRREARSSRRSGRGAVREAAARPSTVIPAVTAGLVLFALALRALATLFAGG